MTNLRIPHNEDPEWISAEDRVLLSQNRYILKKWFIEEFQFIEDAPGKRKAFEAGREYIEDLNVRESIKIALQCWYEERIGVLPRVG